MLRTISRIHRWRKPLLPEKKRRGPKKSSPLPKAVTGKELIYLWVQEPALLALLVLPAIPAIPVQELAQALLALLVLLSLLALLALLAQGQAAAVGNQQQVPEREALSLKAL